jgi:hypothetical protein
MWRRRYHVAAGRVVVRGLALAAAGEVILVLVIKGICSATGHDGVLQSVARLLMVQAYRYESSK